MNILVVFLLVALGCGPAEGVKKCGLREEVLTELQNLQEEGLSLDPKNVTTRLVCHAEKSSNFTTSVVKTQESNGETTTTTTTEHTTQKWTFYGIFQLGNLLVCTDNESTDPEICNYNCSALIDDNVTNDIRCVTAIIRKLLKDGFNQGSKFMEMIRLIYDSECDEYVYSEYFKDCPPA